MKKRAISFLLYVDNSYAYLFKAIIHFSVFYYKYLRRSIFSDLYIKTVKLL